MESPRQKEVRNYVLVKAYRRLWQLDQVIRTARENESDQLQLSVLGKMSEECFSTNDKMLQAKNDLKTYWRGSLGGESDFGLFCNPDFGTLFIAGALVSQFLHDLDGKVLGAFPSGPYGILRGLGIAETEAKEYISKLNEKWYLLLVRAPHSELNSFKNTLERIG